MRGSFRTWAWAAALGLGLSASPGQGEAGFWLGLSKPSPGATHTGPTALAFVRGRAGTGVGGRHDVVLVLDFSGSTLLASGADVDGDGEVGRASRRVEAVTDGVHGQTVNRKRFGERNDGGGVRRFHIPRCIVHQQMAWGSNV